MNNTKNDIVSEKDRNNKNNQVDELLRIYIYIYSCYYYKNE